MKATYCYIININNSAIKKIYINKMSNTLKNINKYSYIIALIIFIPLLIISTWGLTQLKINTHYSAYFSPDARSTIESNYFQQQYGTNDSLIIAIKDKAINTLSAQRIIEYNQLQNALEEITYIRKIVPFYQPFILDSWLDEQIALNDILELYPTQVSRIKTVHQRPESKFLLSRSDQLALINITIDLPKNNPNTMVEFSALLDKKITPLIRSWDEAPDVFYSGTIALNKTYLDIVRHDIKVFIPGILIVFCLGLFYIFRHFSIMLLLMMTSLVSVYIALGLLGLFSFELTAINTFTPVIIITLTLATNIHLIIGYLRQRSLKILPHTAINISMKSNIKPYCLSLISTAFGFLLLATSESPPIKVVGYSIALAMIINMLIGLLLLPKLLVKIKISDKIIYYPKAIFTSWFGKKIANILTYIINEQTKVIISISCIVTGIALLGFTKFKINDDVYQYFPKDHNFNQGIVVIEEEFKGVSQQYYELSTNNGTIFTKAYFDLLYEFSIWANKQNGVAEVISPILDIYKHLDSEQEKPLVELQNKLHSGLFSSTVINQWIKKDQTATKIILLLKKQDAHSLIKLNNKIKQWINNKKLTNIYLKGGSGPDLTFAHLGYQNASSMFYSLVIALLLISLLIGGMEKSLKIALIALVCNFFPVLVVYGIWSLFGGYISLGVALVMGMVMGIIVDDTLHLILKRHQHKHLFSLLCNVAPAIIMTSLLIIIGLIIGLSSNFTPIKELSLLTIFCIIMALIADLLLLPLLLKKIK